MKNCYYYSKQHVSSFSVLWVQLGWPWPSIFWRLFLEPPPNHQYPLWPPHVHSARSLMSGDVRVPSVGLVTNIDAHLKSLGSTGGQIVQDKRDAGLQLLHLRADPSAPSSSKDLSSSFVNPDKLAALVRLEFHTRPFKFDFSSGRCPPFPL